MFHYSLRVIDEPKMSEIRILNLCHKKSILVDFYRQSLLMYYAIINYQFNTGELQNVQKLVKQTLQALLAETGNVNFCTTFEIIFLVDGP